MIVDTLCMNIQMHKIPVSYTYVKIKAILSDKVILPDYLKKSDHRKKVKTIVKSINSSL